MTTNTGDKAQQLRGKVEQAGDKAEQAGNSTSLAMVARVGLIAYGAVHVLIAWLALQIAWGLAGNQSADTSGAMKTLADQPFGRILLWLVAVGLIALALWQGTQAIWGYRDSEGGQRVRSGSPARPRPPLTPHWVSARSRSRSAHKNRVHRPSSRPRRVCWRGPVAGCSSSPRVWSSSASVWCQWPRG